jgi:thiol-disulfide isomerase/thioredoxin
MNNISKLRQVSALVVVILILMGTSIFVSMQAQAARGGASGDSTVIVLSSSWCGTCREIIPVVRRVVSSYSSDKALDLVILDVDDNKSPSIANRYGVTISGSDVPMVYLYNNGRVSQLFSGKNYKFGKSQQAEEQIRQQLEQNL